MEKYVEKEPIFSLCINCEINIGRTKSFRVVEIDERVVGLINTWISPLKATDKDSICGKCCDIINEVLAYNDLLGRSYLGPRLLGHSEVCRICGCSILRNVRFIKIMQDGKPLHTSKYKQLISPRQATDADKICFNRCWRKIQYAVSQNKNNDNKNIENNGNKNIQETRESGDSRTAKEGQIVTNDSCTTKEAQIVTNDYCVTKEPQIVDEITLPIHKRAANSSSRCIVRDCISAERRTINDDCKYALLCESKVYIPSCARICPKHQQSLDWMGSSDNIRITNMFTAQQIEHCVFLYKQKHIKS